MASDPSSSLPVKCKYLVVARMTVNASTKMKIAVLFLCHHIDEPSLAEYHNIRHSLEGLADCWILFHATTDKTPSLVPGPYVYSFTNESVARMKYARFVDSIVPGNAHFPVLRFFLDNRGYEYCWLLEYDVRFSGSWRQFFGHFANVSADFITCHLRKYADEPGWAWWRMEHPRQKIALSDRLRSFNPIYRISATALYHIDRMHREGWRGHDQVLIPTLLFHADFQIADFGGSGAFVPPLMQDKFYLDGPPNKSGSLSSGTVRFRPIFREPGTKENTLYHPVKDIRGSWG
jgi:hypothetical protein